MSQGFAPGTFSLTQDEIISKTGLSVRAVKYSLAALASANLIHAKTSFSDRRRKVYAIKRGVKNE